MNRTNSLWHIYGAAVTLSLILLAVVGFSASLTDLFAVLILAGLEITFSFDNAVVNARILQRMSAIWQKVFLTAGIIIAVFGVRFFLPILLVSLSAGLRIGRVIDLALNHPSDYQSHLSQSHAYISAFGGIFLLMLFLNFILQDREIKWLVRIEHQFARLSQIKNIAVPIGLIFLFLSAFVMTSHDHIKVLLAGLAGLVTFLIISRLDNWIENRRTNKSDITRSVLSTGLIGFLYLELIDASFSLDGVIGAFAITNKVLLIAAGLGIGALFVRSMTVHMLQRGTLQKYRYMEHGAHYAIVILAIILLLSVRYEIPEAVTGLAGLMVIAASVLDSHLESQHNLRLLWRG